MAKLPILSTSLNKNKDKPPHEVEDLGPVINQFDKLGVDEEITSCSGFAGQLTNIDLDANIRNALQKFI